VHSIVMNERRNRYQLRLSLEPFEFACPNNVVARSSNLSQEARSLWNGSIDAPNLVRFLARPVVDACHC
jgi:hypothetical protein